MDPVAVLESKSGAQEKVGSQQMSVLHGDFLLF